MKKWSAFIQVNGYEFTYFPEKSIEISDEWYDKMQEAINSNIPIESLDFYDELEKKFENSIDLEEYLKDDYLGEPTRDEYEDEEEYEEDLEEYISNRECMLDEISVDAVWVNDPGDLVRLKNKFVGKTFPEWKGKQTYKWVYEYDEFSMDTYNVEFELDAEGTVTDITSVYAYALEGHWSGSGDYGTIYPKYKIITEKLEKEYNRQNS